MKVGLVLGGGGSRGLAHVGVLQVLVREGIPIDLIVGTSMGGIVGVLFALGISPHQLAKQMEALKSNGLVNVVRGLSARSRQRMLRNLLTEALDGKTFNDLKIPTTLMAVDMRQGVEVALDQGALMPAALATSAVPAIFPPVELEGQQLADGGVIDSLATHVAFERGADKVIAVDIEPPLEKENPWVDPISAVTGLQVPFIFGSSDWPKTPNIFSSMWRAVRVMSCHVHELRLAAHPPDVLLRPRVECYGSLDFKELQGPMQAGVAEAERHLPELQALAG
ncbi:MAG: patatin-like phospholipase family protein [Anaerolineae bacterium]|jgi:NTE family protein